MLLCAALLLSACGQTNYMELAQQHFPSPGALDPEGSDVFSGSTNMSAKEDDIHPKVGGLAGVAFVKPPAINHFGAVSLSYPLEIPAGRAGMQPSLSLTYSSSGGDGLAGVGWSLSTGLGAISRSTRRGELYYDERDDFTYNGARLMKVSSAFGEEGEYRLEVEQGLLRFEYTAGVWRVYDTNGTVTVYGEDIESRITHPDDPDKTYSWYFTRSTDLNGNYMRAEYDTTHAGDDHIVYLRQIRYTGNEETGFPAHQYVRLHYNERDEPYVSSAPGFLMRMRRIADYVELGWDSPFGSNNEELWRYTLEFEKSGESARPLLKTVASTRYTTQPEFVYRKAEHALIWKKVTNVFAGDTEMNPDSVKYFEGDFNGDGLSDMVFFNPVTGDWKAAEARSDGGYNFKPYGHAYQGYDGAAKIQWFKGNVTGDYNGDGRSDIAFYLPETREFVTALHDGNVFQFRVHGRLYTTDIDPFACEWFPGDYDGNGLSDALLYNEPTGEWTLMRNTGTTFEFTKFAKHFKNLYRGDFQPDEYLNSDATTDASEHGKGREKINFLSGDYNGDGRTDIAVYDARDGKWWLGWTYRDTNEDMHMSWKLMTVFTAPEQALFAHDRFSGDYNGDGLTDVLIFDKDSGVWSLGETGDGTINFRTFSTTPEFKEVTRWLQGDFNGDGRTDIGFYSATDGNLWIGESSPNGFRYIIYNNLADGPDPARVMAAPLPRDEVVIEKGEAIVAGDVSTTRLYYEFNGNYHTDRGERVFPGLYAGSAGALVFDRREDKLFYAEGANLTDTGVTTDLEDADITILNDGKAIRNGGSDTLVYYKKTGSLMSGSQHRVYTIYKNGPWYEYATADFTDSLVEKFSIKESVHLLDEFDAGHNGPEFLALNDLNAAGAHAKFILFNYSSASSSTTLTPYLDNTETDIFDHILSHDPNGTARDRADQVRFYSGQFTTTGHAQLLMIDTRTGTPRAYLGTLDITGGAIDFEECTVGGSFTDAGLVKPYRITDGTLVYMTAQDGRVRPHTMKVTGTSGGRVVTIAHHAELDEGVTFKGEYDHAGKPVLHTAEGTKAYNAGTRTVEELSVSDTTIRRSDLYTKAYPFQWIQGDYNGDGKTDLGIFHLKESEWYFAVTSGTVPDLIHEVKNGIGGEYEFEYANSTSFDNTDKNGLPRLPMNYKVCVKQTVEDGRGNRMSKKYEYAKGYAYSAFINGRKETDYFGFGEFKEIDAMGGKALRYYHAAPYDDFMENRALSGAEYRTRVIGSDLKEYSRTDYAYRILKIGSADKPSYMTEQAKVEKRVRDHESGALTLAQTVTRESEWESGRYVKTRARERSTDHYEDGVHSAATTEQATDYAYTNSTNELRVSRTTALAASACETSTFYTYDTHGNLIQELARYTGSGLASAPQRTVEYGYDGYGNRTMKADTSATPHRVTEYAYDPHLHQFVAEERALGSDAGPLVTKSEYDYSHAFGSIVKKTDPNNRSTYYGYDSHGRLVWAEADTESGRQRTMEYEYQSTFPASAKAVRLTGTGDIHAEIRVYYDGLAREMHTVRSATDTSGRKYVKSGKLVYDDLGRVIRKSQTDWAGDNEIDTYVDNSSEKFPTITEYDPIGRVKKVTLPAAYANEGETSIRTAYNDPWETVETHSIGRSKRVVKNARGQVLYVEDYGTGDTGGEVRAKVGFRYDVAGRRVNKRDLTPDPSPPGEGSTNEATWLYDGMGRMVEAHDPDMGHASMAYNAFGDLVSRTDALGRTTHMSYDALGRMVEKTLPDGEGTVSYEYDTRTGSQNALGRLVMMEDPAQMKEMSYDYLGRVKKETRTLKGDQVPGGEAFRVYETLYEHDLLGRKTKITYPQDPRNSTRMETTYRYTAFGVKKIVADHQGGSTEVIKEVRYNEFGQMTSQTRGNGVETSYEYDIKGRLANLLSTTEANGTYMALQDVRYTFNVAGSITAMENTPELDPEGARRSTIRHQYQYDGLNRLTHANGTYERSNGFTSERINAYEHAFSYAPNGNMLTKETRDPDTHALNDRWTYNYRNHAVTSIDSSAHGLNSHSMTYDSCGNMTRQEDGIKNLVKEMAYDSSNRIKTVTNPGNGEVVGRYFYDDGGFRVLKISKREDEGLVYTHAILYPSQYIGVEVQVNDDNSEVADSYAVVNNIYMNGVRVAALTPSGESRYYLTDQVDSVKVVTDKDGKPMTRMEYLPYGEAWFTEGDGTNAPKFNSQELDEESGFYFYNARYYDASICRFVTADNVIDGEGDTQGWNRYSYTKGNPIRYKDPTGHGVPIYTDDNMPQTKYPVDGTNRTDQQPKTSSTVEVKETASQELVEGNALKANDKIIKNSPSADKLIKIIENNIYKDDVRPGSPDASGNKTDDKGKPLTWCNRAAMRIIEDANAALDPLLLESSKIPVENPTKEIQKGWTNTHTINKNGKEAAEDINSGVKIITPEDAQNNANKGRVVVASQAGHIGIVHPDSREYDASRGPLIGQAGGANGVFYHRDSYKKEEETSYFLLEQRKD